MCCIFAHQDRRDICDGFKDDLRVEVLDEVCVKVRLDHLLAALKSNSQGGMIVRYTKLRNKDKELI